jgi:hypothetical protein
MAGFPEVKDAVARLSFSVCSVTRPRAIVGEGVKARRRQLAPISITAARPPKEDTYGILAGVAVAINLS